MTSDDRYTLDEARKELERQECLSNGHDWNIIEEGTGEPIILTCSRCGTKRAVADKRGSVEVHKPRRDDDVEVWIKRWRDTQPTSWAAIDDLLDRYRECADYGLTLRPEDDERGDP